MKTSIVFLSLLVALAAACHAEIIAGPITNPENGHDYYLLSPNSWSASEAEAETLGGTLAIIKNAAEQEWVFSKFGAVGGTNRNLWIGFHRETPGGRFISMLGTEMNYSHWLQGQPDNGGGVENCVQIWTTASPQGEGFWNDAVDWTMCNGVVEVPGKSNEKALTEKEKSLTGLWYHNGDASQRCWIAAAGNALFAINSDNQDASRIVITTEGFLFSSKWKRRAEIVEDKILWSNGVWWSRTPMENSTVDNAEEDSRSGR